LPIPELNDEGLLPPGLHLVTLEEVESRFGKEPQVRSTLYQRLVEFVGLARYVEAHRLFIGGSFVTTKQEPGDIDIVIWLGESFLELLEAGDEKALDLELRFLTRIPKEAFAVFDEEGWQSWIEFFSLLRSRRDSRKGLLEVKLS
jgi:hypothetical protein